MSRLINMIFNDSERGIHTGMILLELQKVLDILDHKIWLEKQSA